MTMPLRRSVFALTLSGLGLAGLAACGNGDGATAAGEPVQNAPLTPLTPAPPPAPPPAPSPVPDPVVVSPAPPPPAPPTVSKLVRAPLPLGVGSLPERWEQCVISDGVILTRIVRGSPTRLAAPLPCLDIEAFPLMGGGSGRPTVTQEGPPVTDGPWGVHVLEVDPKVFAGKMRAVLGQDTVVGKEKPSDVGIRLNAVASVNGGYFVVGEGNDQINADGIAGDPAGLAYIDGRYVSEAVDGRANLGWTNEDAGSAFFPIIEDKLFVQVEGGEAVEIDGLNRVPGRIRMCGGAGDTPTETPRHDQTCTDADELIWFAPIYGRDTPTEHTRELLIDAAGKPMGLRAAGGAIPAGGAVLAALGSAAEAKLTALAAASKLTLDVRLTREGAPYAPPARLSTTNGGPLLLQGGVAVDRNAAEGFVEPLLGTEPEQSLIQYGINLVYLTGYRLTGQPRTLAATTAEGRLLFVTVDGRRSDWSVGLSFQDAQDLLLHFGATEGLNIDGGGSAAMWVRSDRPGAPAGAVVNVVSGGGERAVSDSIVLLPPAPRSLP